MLHDVKSSGRGLLAVLAAEEPALRGEHRQERLLVSAVDRIDDCADSGECCDPLFWCQVGDIDLPDSDTSGLIERAHSLQAFPIIPWRGEGGLSFLLYANGLDHWGDCCLDFAL